MRQLLPQTLTPLLTVMERVLIRQPASTTDRTTALNP